MSYLDEIKAKLEASIVQFRWWVVFAIAAFVLPVISCNVENLSPSELEKIANDPNILQGDVFRQEVEKVKASLAAIAAGERDQLTPFEQRVLLLKHVQHALATGGASRIEGVPGRETAPVTLRMIETYFLQEGSRQPLSKAEILKRLQRGDAVDENLRDALVARAAWQASRNIACYAYRKDSGEIVCASPECAEALAHPRTACTPKQGKPCQPRGGGFQYCNDGCDLWWQLEISDPDDPGIVYVYCVDIFLNPRSCPASGGRSWKAGSAVHAPCRVGVRQ